MLNSLGGLGEKKDSFFFIFGRGDRISNRWNWGESCGDYVSIFFKTNPNVSSFILAALGLCGCMGFSLVAAGGGWSLGARVASHCGGRCHCGAQASAVEARGLRFLSTGSVVMVQRLSCSLGCGIFPGQGSKSFPLHWQVDSLPLSPEGSPDYVSQWYK